MAQFDLQPTLSGDLLVIRPIRVSDYETLYQAASDPLIWEQHPEPTRYQREVFQKFFDGAVQCGSGFVVLDKATGQLIGSSRYWDYRPDADQIEIGFTFLVRSHWGGKYNAELKRLMLDYIHPYVRRVVFMVGPENWRSRKAMEKIGGKLLPQTECDDTDRGHPRVVYYIDRPE